MELLNLIGIIFKSYYQIMDLIQTHSFQRKRIVEFRVLIYFMIFIHYYQL